MITTISRPDFAQDIISRYTSGAQVHLSGSDLLFMRARKENGDERTLAQSIKNIYLIQRAITENTVYNLNIHLNFLHTIFNKTVRKLHESTARHIRMLEKRTEQAGQVTLVNKILRSGPAFLPNPFHSDFPNPPLGLEAKQNRADTLSLVFSGTPDSAGKIEKKSKSQRTDHVDDGTKTVQAVRFAGQTKKAEAGAQTAGNVATPLKRELLSETILNMPSWVRELWLIEPNTTTLVDENVVLTFPQAWQRDIVTRQPNEQTRASRTSLILNGNMQALPRGQTPLRDHVHETHSNVFLPKLPGLSHITPTDAAGVERLEAPHIMSRTHPASIQTNMLHQREKVKESNQTQRSLSRFTAASDITFNHQPKTKHIDRAPLSSPENQHKSNTSGRRKQSPNSGKAASIVHRTAEPAPIPYPSTAQNSWSNMHHTNEKQNAEVKMLQKIWSYRYVPRQDAKPDLNGVLFTEAHVPLFHGDRSHTSAIDRPPVFNGVEYAFIPKITGESREIPVSANSSLENSPIRSITGGVQNNPPNRFVLASNDIPPFPVSRARTVQTIKEHALFPAANFGFAQASANGALNQAETSAALTQPPMLRAGQAKTGALPETLASGAVIVYRKESPAHQEPPPVPPSVSQDIEFIKKTVKQSSASVRPQKANVAVNLPSFAASSSANPEVDTLRDIERQAAVIADKVYNTLERRLRSEQMRKGLL